MTEPSHHSAPVYASDVAFTPSVKAIQSRKGSRRGYAKMEEGGSWETAITPALADFIAKQTSIFFGTASKEGQPYIQHRGGPAGFLRVLDAKTIAFADFAGNRQYITQGNLAADVAAALEERDSRIKALEAEIEVLRAGPVKHAD